jgi:tetratricopeptide (TPR) repeat protein
LVQLNLFEKLVQENRLNEARAVLPVVNQLDTNPAVKEYTQANLALLEGKPQVAIDLLLEAIALEPRQGTYYACLAKAYAEEGRLADARASLQKQLSCPLTVAEAAAFQMLLASTNELAAWGHYSRALGMLNKGDWNGARDGFNKAAELHPNGGSGIIAYGFKTLGWVHFLQHEFAEATADFRKASELGFRDDSLFYYMWLSRSRMGETGAATRELQNYLDSRKSNGSDDWAVAVGNFLAGRLTEAELLKSVGGSENGVDEGRRCEAYFYAGYKRLIGGEKDMAAEYFGKSIATNAREVPEYQCAADELQVLKGK